LSRAHAGSEAPESWKVVSATEVNKTLQIVLVGGRTVIVPPSKDQCSFDQIRIGPDGVTVGWSEGGFSYGDGEPPCRQGDAEVETGPIFWRRGKIIRRFVEGGAVLCWSFYRGGDVIALQDSPSAHFEGDLPSTLFDVSTGRVLKTWSPSDKGDAPDWADPCNDPL